MPELIGTVWYLLPGQQGPYSVMTLMDDVKTNKIRSQTHNLLKSESLDYRSHRISHLSLVVPDTYVNNYIE